MKTKTAYLIDIDREIADYENRIKFLKDRRTRIEGMKEVKKGTIVEAAIDLPAIRIDKGTQGEVINDPDQMGTFSVKWCVAQPTQQEQGVYCNSDVFNYQLDCGQISILKE
jgi:hypothetical protein